MFFCFVPVHGRSAWQSISKTMQSECLSVYSSPPLCLPSPSSLSSHSGVQLQFLPCLPGAHGVCWGAELPAAASRRRQQLDLARRPRSENGAHADGQTAAAARHRRDPGTWRRSLSGVERWRGTSDFQMCFKSAKLVINKGKQSAQCVWKLPRLG